VTLKLRRRCEFDGSTVANRRSGGVVLVESEAIAEIDYESANSTLFVRFAHGGWYSYFMVPPKAYAEFLAAESHGRFFQENIRDHYPYRPGR
jgi:KTSC domain